MAQNFEYPMWSPHKRADLFKRYDGELPAGITNKVVSIDDKEMHNGVVIIEGYRYVYSGSIKWVETTAEQSQDEQPLDGLIVPNSYITIKTNSLKEIKTGDVIRLPDGTYAGLWIVTDGATKDYAYTPKQVQTFQHLPLSSVG